MVAGKTVMLWRGCPLGSGPASRARRPAGKVEFARLLKDQGHTLGEIAAKTSIPKTTLHRYLTPEPATERSEQPGAAGPRGDHDEEGVQSPGRRDHRLG
jgi:hypothetical protein